MPNVLVPNDLYAGGEIPPAVAQLLQKYRDKQQEIDGMRPGNNLGKQLVTATRNRAKLEEKNAKIQEIEAEKQQLWQQLRKLDPVLSSQIQPATPNLAAMQQLIDDDKTAILSFYTTANDTHVFVVQQNQVSCHSCLGQGQETLQNWIWENWLIPYISAKPAWESNISSVLKELAQRLQINDLIAKHLAGIEELIVVPHLYLRQIPFAAMPLPHLSNRSGSFPEVLGDKFLIRDVPSCQVLEFCKKRPSITPETSLEYGIVEDATEDLPCASFEGEQIAQLYRVPDARRHRGRQKATVANYRQLAKQVQGILSTHHAQSRLDNPLQSELQLGDGSITLGELLTPGWRLPQLVDVFLSCCETGLGLPENPTDDILTLSFGFLCAGARSVVSTLWAVDDLAAALFSIFYHQHKQQLSRPAALRMAQAELRNLTGETLATKYQPLLMPLLTEKLKQTHTALKLAQKQSLDTVNYWNQRYDKVVKARENLDSACQKQLPFSDYIYWAAFTCQGLR